MTAEVEKVEDIAAIMGYGVTATPALVVDERVLVSGRVPNPTQIEALLRGV
jgi:predicted DsbA family dithiol-disulfide isomerase